MLCYKCFGYVERMPILIVREILRRLFEHPVLSSRKSEELQVLLVEAATVQGTSLNGRLLQGSDWTTPWMIGSLCRFQANKVATSAECLFRRKCRIEIEVR